MVGVVDVAWADVAATRARRSEGEGENRDSGDGGDGCGEEGGSMKEGPLA